MGFNSGFKGLNVSELYEVLCLEVGNVRAETQTAR